MTSGLFELWVGVISKLGSGVGCKAMNKIYISGEFRGRFRFTCIAWEGESFTWQKGIGSCTNGEVGLRKGEPNGLLKG